MKYILHSYTAANVIAGSITSTVTVAPSLTELARLIEAMRAPVPIPDDLAAWRLPIVQYAETHPVFVVEVVGQQSHLFGGHYA
jgi:hypothetical protein